MSSRCETAWVVRAISRSAWEASPNRSSISWRTLLPDRSSGWRSTLARRAPSARSGSSISPTVQISVSYSSGSTGAGAVMTHIAPKVMA